ncbi:Hypothetical predicted protein [Pelobates cultripes]|uniref:Uncharacterized protein n=1 Tax=Pelobates cultripes TaxID=61616 RepID=A0AAD1T6K1_PELCU|nr:Hypothetical predicted protein [Pelobates cultripes]
MYNLPTDVLTLSDFLFPSMMEYLLNSNTSIAIRIGCLFLFLIGVCKAIVYICEPNVTIAFPAVIKVDRLEMGCVITKSTSCTERKLCKKALEACVMDGNLQIYYPEDMKGQNIVVNHGSGNWFVETPITLLPEDATETPPPTDGRWIRPVIIICSVIAVAVAVVSGVYFYKSRKPGTPSPTNDTSQHGNILLDRITDPKDQVHMEKENGGANDALLNGFHAVSGSKEEHELDNT